MPSKESIRSPIWNGDGTAERIFVVWDVTDEAQAAAQAVTAASPTYFNLNRQGPKLHPLNDAFSLWECSFTYNAQPVQSEDPGGGGGGSGGEEDPPEGIIEFDGGGGTQHITQSLKTVNKVGTGAAAEIPDFKQAIGVVPHAKEVQGTDVAIPAGTLTVTKHWLIEEINGAHIKGLISLIGKVNQTAYTIDGEAYKPHELLFSGVRGSRRDKKQWEITYSFSFSEERNNIPITPDMQINKRGHDYVWVLYEADVDAKNFLQVPKAAYSEQIYEEADFQYYLGFPEPPAP